MIPLAGAGLFDLRESHMRKTILSAILLFIVLATFTGCSGNNSNSHNITNQTTGVGDVLASLKEDSKATEITATTTTEGNSSTEGSESFTHPFNGADIDLTVLNANMVYAQVFCMVTEPDEYVGMIVRMEGQFVFYHDEQTDKNYYACIIRDAAACCAQGLEFEPTDDFTYPDDFPADGENIRVTGVFASYEEDGNKYLTLRDAVIEPIPED